MLLVAAATMPPAAAQGGAVQRGKALYEARCKECHEQSVHNRTIRSARSAAEVRGFVVRWDQTLGSLWRGDEIDAVTRYLNEAFYRYPCSPEACGSDTAALTR